MYNKTKGVMGNNIDIKIRKWRNLYEKCRFKNINDDLGCLRTKVSESKALGMSGGLLVCDLLIRLNFDN